MPGLLKRLSNMYTDVFCCHIFQYCIFVYYFDFIPHGLMTNLYPPYVIRYATPDCNLLRGDLLNYILLATTIKGIHQVLNGIQNSSTSWKYFSQTKQPMEEKMIKNLHFFSLHSVDPDEFTKCARRIYSGKIIALGNFNFLACIVFIHGLKELLQLETSRLNLDDQDFSVLCSISYAPHSTC